MVNCSIPRCWPYNYLDYYSVSTTGSLRYVNHKDRLEHSTIEPESLIGDGAMSFVQVAACATVLRQVFCVGPGSVTADTSVPIRAKNL
jgi:hypothetical protein